MQGLIRRVLNRESEITIKIWSVEHRRMAKNSNEVLIPGNVYYNYFRFGWVLVWLYFIYLGVEVLFTSKDDALNFRKGAASRAKSKEKDFENVYFSLYVGLQTRVRIEVKDERFKS